MAGDGEYPVYVIGDGIYVGGMGCAAVNDGEYTDGTACATDAIVGFSHIHPYGGGATIAAGVHTSGYVCAYSFGTPPTDSVCASGCAWSCAYSTGDGSPFECVDTAGPPHIHPYGGGATIGAGVHTSGYVCAYSFGTPPTDSACASGCAWMCAYSTGDGSPTEAAYPRGGTHPRIGAAVDDGEYTDESGRVTDGKYTDESGRLTDGKYTGGLACATVGGG